MIPIRSQNRHKTKPVIAWLIAVTCTAVLVRLASLPTDRASEIVEALGLVPARFLAGLPGLDQLVTLVTCCFLHAGWIHLAGNLLFLLVFGPAVEDAIGHGWFLALFVVAGVAGALSQVAVHPDSMAPLVGASGAIAGVLGAHLVLAPRARVTTLIPVLVVFEVASLPAAFVIGAWFLMQLASGLAPVTGAAENVAWFAHLGGFTAGFVLCAPAAARNWLDRRAGNKKRKSRTKRSNRKAA
jgi:membrane associated rhomboid family serine protease